MKPLSAKQHLEIANLFQQGQREVQLSLLDQAEYSFARILKINPELLEARAFLAFVFSASKQHAKATQELRALLKSGRNLAQTHHNLANSLFEQQLYGEAITHYQAAIHLEPTRVESHIHCGIAQRMLKHYDAAIQCLYNALNLDNRNARAFHVLGMIFVDQGEYPRALECLENATGLMPKEAQYRVSFAETLSKVGLDYEAGIELHSACELNPNHADGFIAYGQYLLEQHRLDEALECFQHARLLAPDNLLLRDNLGLTYTGMGDIERALTFFDSALQTDPKRISSLFGKGQAYIDIGDSSEVMNIASDIIEINSTIPHGYLLQCNAKKSKNDDGLTQALINFTNNDSLDTESKIAIHFTLGKLFDDQNHYAEAFKHYAQGNLLRNAELDYSIEEDVEKFNQIIAHFNQPFFQAHQHLGTDLSLPIIIVGMPRSSTTLTEQIISSHPEVMGAGEVIFWSRSPTALPLRIGSQTPYPACTSELSVAQAKDIALMYEDTLRKITGPKTLVKHITDKMPHNFLNLGLIALLFPKVKIIHTKRNPIDTCLSIFFQNFNKAHPYAFDLSNLGFHYKQYERIMRHWHEVLPGRIMDIQYEDTISDPEYWSRKLIDHIGLEWNDACLAPHKLERTVKTASHWQVRQPIYKTSVERWKNYEEFLGPLIDALKD